MLDFSNKVLYVVIPCYNEEEVLPITSKQFLEVLELLISKKKISSDSRIMFVNDGSSDKTWEIIERLSSENEHFIGISQSRNRGHQSTVLAGLMEATSCADVTISIDCDGQDDIFAMEEMIDCYNNGYDVVYGVRKCRETDTWFKRTTAETFYKTMKWLGADVVFNHADYRLISTKVLKEFSNYKEVNLFLRGMIPLVGFESTEVLYDRNVRLAGESHYPLKKMIGLAIDGITSLSIKPLRMIVGLGLFISLVSFIGVIWAIISELTGKTVTGWASMTCIICFVSGIQLLSLGVIGEYIGKIYLETKQRPRYIINKRTERVDSNGEKQ